MKKFIRYIIIATLIVTLAFSLYKVTSKYSMDILVGEITSSILAKGCEGARALTQDEKGNVYIAYKDSFKSVDKEGKEKEIYKSKDLNIEDILYNKGNLIFISGDRLISYSLKEDKVNILQSGIIKGDNGVCRKLLLKDDSILISIPAWSNAGISNGEPKDLTPIDITLSGENFGALDTGAFKDYGVRSEKEEKLPPEAIGNAAIYSFDLKNKYLKLYASGIKAVEGMDINSDGKIFALFQGMKDVGLRPVKNDSDYIYEVKKGSWYGWPDYSGGDSITSPRFKGNVKLNNIILNPPTKNVEGPIYQHDSVDSLRELTIDKYGVLLEMDTLVFWDKNASSISILDSEGIYHKLLNFKNTSYIQDIIFTNNGLLVLDSSLGVIYNIHEKENFLGFKLPMVIWVFLIVLTLILFLIMVYKMVRKKK